ncbi:hypothetical protein [Microlunatus parietis]|uniref:Uncharacterized protein n=1 Tax=Microlunatus parietis TaxID=682979 RepID=A0A7Y9LB44_9ACTN|nr:hypothetical protein [Microlunatus parietis]NYE71327.1 hypothetical protein [Microlunatus parietis]
MIEATDPYAPFMDNDWIAQVLARSTLAGEGAEDALEYFRTPGRRYREPGSEWLHTVLRPTFQDQLPDDDLYSTEFSRAEAMLGALSADLASSRTVVPGRRLRGMMPPRWIGRALDRNAAPGSGPVASWQEDLRSQGSSWAPLRVGLFGGEKARVETALDSYGRFFQGLARFRRGPSGALRKS